MLMEEDAVLVSEDILGLIGCQVFGVFQPDCGFEERHPGVEKSHIYIRLAHESSKALREGMFGYAVKLQGDIIDQQHRGAQWLRTTS